MVYILLADGFEEIEALTPYDMLKRSGVAVKTVGIGTRTPTGSHGIRVYADLYEDEVTEGEPECIILPGGMPGAKNLDESAFVDKLVRKQAERGALIAAICAAPFILGKRGILKGKAATCFPGFEDQLIGAKVIDTGLTCDSFIITAKAMGYATAFSKQIIAKLCGEDTADKICQSIFDSTDKNFNPYRA